MLVTQLLHSLKFLTHLFFSNRLKKVSVQSLLMLGAVEKLQIVASFHYSSIYKNNNCTTFTKSAVHNKLGNCASEKKESRSENAMKSIAIVKSKF